MQIRRLGNSELQITQIGIGAWAMGGGGWAWGWGHQDENDSIAAIHAAVDRGINWIDTAPIYGLGRSEEVVGRALQGRSLRPYVFTKCGRFWAAEKITACLKRAFLRQEVEGSLRRLKAEIIDLYQIHWPQPQEDIEEGWEEMVRLQREGKVCYIGISNFNVNEINRVLAISPITSLQARYSILARSVEEEILPFAQKKGIGVIAYSPMHPGLLAGSMTRQRINLLPPDDWRKRNADFQDPLLSRNLRITETLRAIGKRHNRGPGEVAIAWTLHNAAVTGAIVGVRSAKQVSRIIGDADFRLSEVEIAEIDEFVRSETNRS